MNILLNTYFNDTHCAFLITQNCVLNYHGYVPIVNIEYSTANRQEYLEHVMSTLHYGCQNIIIQVDEPATVINDFEQQIKLQVQRFNDRRYLVLPFDNSVEIDDLPSIPVLQFVPDVLVVVPEIDLMNVTKQCSSISCAYCECNVTFRFITHRFVGTNRNDDVIVLDYWYSSNMSFSMNNNLYPDKITDMQGKVFKMATFNYKPYSIVGMIIITC